MEKEEMKMNVKALSDITKIVVETDEQDPKTIAVITAKDIDSAEGFRVRITPKYEIEIRGDKNGKITIQKVRKEYYEIWNTVKEFIKQEFPEASIGSNFADIIYGNKRLSIIQKDGGFGVVHFFNGLIVSNFQIDNVVDLMKHLELEVAYKKALSQKDDKAR